MKYDDKIHFDLQNMTPKLKPSEYITYIDLYNEEGLNKAYHYVKETTKNR